MLPESFVKPICEHLLYSIISSVKREDYLSTFDFLNKLAEGLRKKLDGVAKL